MRALRVLLLVVVAVALATPALAINSGTDIVVPAGYQGAGAGGSQWLTTIYIFNPGTSDASVTVYWLMRNHANASPASTSFTVPAGQTMVLADAIGDTFSTTGGGAFRIMSDVDVVVNAAILNQAGGTEYGQGFEGIPVASAIQAGATTEAMGLASNDNYRTNFYVMDVSGSGSSVTVSLLDASGTTFASRNYTLQAWEPILPSITDLGAGDFSYATLRVTVNSGAVVAGASRVNNSSGDALTLQSWWECGAGGGGGATLGGPGIYTGYTDFTYQGGLYLDVMDAGDGTLQIDVLGGALTLFSPDDGGMNCANVYGYSAELDTPWVLDADGNFDGTFQVQYSSGATLTFHMVGQLTDDSILGNLDLNVSGAGAGKCGGDMNTTPFYTGHTILTFN